MSNGKDGTISAHWFYLWLHFQNLIDNFIPDAETESSAAQTLPQVTQTLPQVTHIPFPCSFVKDQSR